MTPEVALFVLDARATPAWVVSAYFVRHNTLPVSYARITSIRFQHDGLQVFYLRLAQLAWL